MLPGPTQCSPDWCRCKEVNTHLPPPANHPRNDTNYRSNSPHPPFSSSSACSLRSPFKWDSATQLGSPHHTPPGLAVGFHCPSGSPMADSDPSTLSGNDSSSASSREEYGRTSKVFSEDEESLIARMYSLIGKRWDLIAGRIPGRTAEEIEKYWTARLLSSE